MKSKDQLTTELRQFFKQEVNPILAKYNRERKEDVLPVVITRVCSTVGILCIFAGTIYPVLILPGFIAIFFLFLYYGLSKNKKIKRTTNKRNNSTTYSLDIEDDYEMTIKRELMPKFLKLFDTNLVWHKYSDVVNEAVETTKQGQTADPLSQFQNVIKNICGSDLQLSNLDIFEDSNFITFDDIITAHEQEVPADIIETKFGLSATGNAARYFIIGIFALPFVIPAIGLLLIFLSFLNETLMFIVLILLLISIPLAIIAAVITSVIKVKKAHSRAKSVILRFKIPKSINAHTVIFEKNKNFKPKNKNERFEKINLEDVVFTGRYDTYSTNQVEARYLLTTAFMQRFEDLKTFFTAKRIRAEFVGDELIILIETGQDLFQMGSLTKDTTYITFKTMLNEIYSVLSIAQQLNLDSKTGL